MPYASPLNRASGRFRFRAIDVATTAILRVQSLGDDVAGSLFTRFDANRIAGDAEALDADPKRRTAPLAGLTVAIKDLFDEKGEVTTAGSVLLAQNAPAEADAPVVARLKAAGALPFGRTNMSEFAYSGVGLNPHFGTPGNAHDPRRIPGGSTSGGAVAAALGLADVALGSDTGGSVRIPAAFNGLAGFKPTQSSVPVSGAFPLSGTYDSIGPLARDIATCAAVHAVLAGQSRPDRPLASADLKIGVVGGMMTEALDDQVAADLATAIQALERAGIKLVDIDFPPVREAAAVHRVIVTSEAYRIHAAYLDRLETSGDPHVLRRLRKAESFTAADEAEARRIRERACGAFVELGRDFDAFIAPTVSILAPTIEDAEADFDRLNGQILRNPGVVNFFDGCAATVPMNRPGTLPSGLMCFAPAGSDWTVLAAAETIEAILTAGWH